MSLLLSLHQLLLGYFRLFTQMLRHLLSVLSALRSVVLPNYSKNFISIFWSYRRSSFSAFHDDLNKFSFVLSIGIKRKPVIEIPRTDTPSVSNAFWTDQWDPLDFWEENGSWGGEWEVVLVDDNKFFIEGDLWIVVKYFCHSNVL